MKRDNKTTFKIPITWMMKADIEIYATSEQEAINILNNNWKLVPIIDGEYIEGSIKTNEKKI